MTTTRTGGQWAALVQPRIDAILASSDSETMREQTRDGMARLNLAGVLADVPVTFTRWRGAVLTSLQATAWWARSRASLELDDDHLFTFVPELAGARDVKAFASAWGVICEAAAADQAEDDLGDRQVLLAERRRLLARIADVDTLLSGR